MNKTYARGLTTTNGDTGRLANVLSGDGGSALSPSGHIQASEPAPLATPLTSIHAPDAYRSAAASVAGALATLRHIGHHEDNDQFGAIIRTLEQAKADLLATASAQSVPVIRTAATVNGNDWFTDHVRASKPVQEIIPPAPSIVQASKESAPITSRKESVTPSPRPVQGAKEGNTGKPVQTPPSHDPRSLALSLHIDPVENDPDDFVWDLSSDRVACTIGRKSDCDVVICDHTRTVSRHHATITRKANGDYLYHGQSGSDGKAVTSIERENDDDVLVTNGSRPAVLRDGDVLVMGPKTLHVRIRPQTTSKASKPVQASPTVQTPTVAPQPVQVAKAACPPIETRDEPPAAKKEPATGDTPWMTGTGQAMRTLHGRKLLIKYKSKSEGWQGYIDGEYQGANDSFDAICLRVVDRCNKLAGKPVQVIAPAPKAKEETPAPVQTPKPAQSKPEPKASKAKTLPTVPTAHKEIVALGKPAVLALLLAYGIEDTGSHLKNCSAIRAHVHGAKASEPAPKSPEPKAPKTSKPAPAKPVDDKEARRAALRAQLAALDNDDSQDAEETPAPKASRKPAAKKGATNQGKLICEAMLEAEATKNGSAVTQVEVANMLGVNKNAVWGQLTRKLVESGHVLPADHGDSIARFYLSKSGVALAKS